MVIKRRRLNKKGSALDFLVIALFMGIFVSVFLIFGGKTLHMIQDLSQPILNNATHQAEIDKVVGYTSIIDYAFAFLFFTTMLVAIILSFFINTHPALFFINILLTVIIVVMGFYATQIYDGILGLDIFVGEATTYPLTNWIMEHFVMILLVFVILQSVVMYGSIRGDF